MKKFTRLVEALARQADEAWTSASPCPAADHYITILVRRPRPEVPLGHVQAFAAPLRRPLAEGRLLADGLLHGGGVEHVLERVREFVETGLVSPL